MSQKEASKRWYEKHKTEIAEKRKGTRSLEGKLYYEKTKELRKEKQREYYLRTYPDRLAAQNKWRKENPARQMLSRARCRARDNNLDFNLELSDIIIPDYCPYLNIPLSVYLEKDNSPSLDRIDNTKGYIKGNIEVISLLANQMKNRASTQQLILFANNILNRYKDYE